MEIFCQIISIYCKSTFKDIQPGIQSVSQISLEKSYQGLALSILELWNKKYSSIAKWFVAAFNNELDRNFAYNMEHFSFWEMEDLN